MDTTTVAGGIEYYDGILVDNDARFVFSFVRAAIEAGHRADSQRYPGHGFFTAINFNAVGHCVLIVDQGERARLELGLA